MSKLITLLVFILFFSCNFYPQNGIKEITSEPFTTMRGEKSEIERGILVVPENRITQVKNKIEIPFIRFKGEMGVPTFHLAGGPGNSSVSQAKGKLFAYINKFRKIGDVILFDQRGTGKMSKPSLSISGNFEFDLSKALDSEENIEIFRTSMRKVKEEMEDNNINLSAYNTTENAHDLEDLRIALGYDKINLFAHSYGTHLALTYMKLYGKNVQRVILSGTNGPDQRYRRPSDADSVYGRIDSIIEQIPSLRKSIPNFTKLVKTFNQRLSKQAEVVEISVDGSPASITLGAADISVTTIIQGGRTSVIEQLPSRYLKLKNGDFSYFGAATYNTIKARGMGTAMTYAMHAASGLSKERRNLIENEKKESVLGNAINFPFYHIDMVKTLEINDLGDDFRKMSSMDIPVLFVNGDLDLRTSIQDSKEIMAFFPNGHQIIVNNASHDAIFLAPELLSISKDFLKGEKIEVDNIKIPFQFKSPQENQIFQGLKKIYANEGIEGCIRVFEEYTTSGQTQFYITSPVLVRIADELQRFDRDAEAIRILELNHKTFPQDLSTISTLISAYNDIGDEQKALEFVKKSYALNPFDRVWIPVFKKYNLPYED